MKNLASPRRVSPKLSSMRNERGVVLIFALLVLVAMTLAGAALMRSVDSATYLSTNLIFRQSATVTADKGVEAAIIALRNMALNNPPSLLVDGGGYFATLPTTDIDFTGSATPATADNFNWSTDAESGTLETSTGNTYDYVIHRLCAAGTGALDAKTCSVWMATAKGGASSSALVGGETYRDPTLPPRATSIRGLYRITVRVSGPRDTYSYIQATVAM